jgi:hypothetical protein
MKKRIKIPGAPSKQECIKMTAFALALAINAPSLYRAKLAQRDAEEIAQRLTKAEVEKAKRMALRLVNDPLV